MHDNYGEKRRQEENLESRQFRASTANRRQSSTATGTARLIVSPIVQPLTVETARRPEHEPFSGRRHVDL